MFLFSNRKKTLNHPLLFSHYGLIFCSGKLPQRRQALSGGRPLLTHESAGFDTD